LIEEKDFVHEEGSHLLVEQDVLLHFLHTHTKLFEVGHTKETLFEE